uniref:Diphthine--ammonia ligase n=1 Tax=Neogobius melanostomus TaxID=47308 RepID=A0A8C6UH00_9GOBI
MRVVALISGGKDSCYNMMQCVAAGHRLVALANLRPAHTDELDSYMYQTVGHQAIGLYAEAMDLPLYRRTIQGSSVDTSRDYSHTPGDEVEDLYELLRLVKEKESVEAVSVGAILSDYQRVRVENVCSRLGLQPLAYLWRRDQESLLSEMVSADLHAILIKVAAVGLDPEKHLGKSLAEMQPYLKQLSKKYGVHICGEGGEYETFTLDCPLFKKKIVIDAWETVIHSADAFAPVGYLRFTEMHTENKGSDAAASVLPRGACPCRSAVDEMTEEAEYADGAGDEPRAFAWSGDLACQPARDVPPSWSQRTSRGFQWVAGINGLRSQAPDIQTQASAAFLQLQSELDSKGWNMTDIVLVHLYVKNMEDFMALNTVYKQHFGLNPPARVCVQAPLPDAQLLLMDCLLHAWSPSAVVGEDEECCSRRREALHVQSMSHWAPANIGPYSQAYRDTLGRPDVAPCPFSVTVVPSLPKGASVELHVTASLDDPDQRTSCHVVSKMAGIECRGARSVDGRSACVSLSLAGRGLEEADVARTVQDLGTVFRKASEEMGAELVPLCARAFYKWDHPVALQVIKGLEDALRSGSGRSSPALCPVPVLELSQSHVVLLSCWFCS